MPDETEGDRVTEGGLSLARREAHGKLSWADRKAKDRAEGRESQGTQEVTLTRVGMQGEKGDKTQDEENSRNPRRPLEKPWNGDIMN
jgi:hypothetical protein